MGNKESFKLKKEKIIPASSTLVGIVVFILYLGMGAKKSGKKGQTKYSPCKWYEYLIFTTRVRRKFSKYPTIA
jgi:hypothetical protein